MGRKKIFLVVGGVLAVLCIAVGLGLFWGANSVPPISEQLMENTSRLSVQIVYPFPRSEWPLNSFIPVQVMAQGAEPIENVELYINDVLLSAQEGRSDSFAGSWMWQPGVTGDFILTARVVGQSGAASLSDPLRITAIEATSWNTLLVAQGGETLAGIAQEQGISLDSIQQSNLQLDPQQPLEPQQKIFIPNPPAPVVNEQIIAPLPASQQPEVESGSGNPPPESSDADDGSPSGQATNIFDDLSFMFQLSQSESDQSTVGKDPAEAPAAPTLLWDFTGCDVKLTINGWYTDSIDPLAIKRDEDGFFVYRSRDGGDFERIFTIAPVHDSKDEKNLNLTDPNQYGELTYYVSAFNVLGESASNPVTIPISSLGNCKAPARAGSGAGGIKLQDGNLILPFKMDLAYLYLQINGSKAVRVPEGDRSFLPESGVMFNVFKYLDSLGKDLPASDLNLHMEVWGWSGGKLIFVGEFDTVIHRTVLLVCSVPGEGGCTGSGGGQWVSSLELPQAGTLNDLIYEVRWQVSSLTSAEKIHLVLAAAPFTGDAYNASPKLLWAYQPWVEGNEGVYLLYLGHILYPDPPNTELGWGDYQHMFDYTTNGFLGEPVGQPFTLYLRATPALKMKGLSDVSNVVPIMYKTSLPPDDLPPLASPYVSIYTVEILEDTYTPPSFYDPELWGCVQIEEDPTNQFQVGQVICPGKDVTYADPCGDTPELICLMEFGVNSLGWVYDQVVNAYELYLQTVIGGVQDIIPGCNQSDECKKAVDTTIKEAWEAVSGIPADLPSSDELIADTIAEQIVTSAAEAEKYYTEQDFSLIEEMCREELADCKKKISDAVKQELKETRSIQAQKTCLYPYEAYFHGRQPVCLDPSIIVHAAPGSADLPASVMVRVTRANTAASLAAVPADKDKYRLLVSVEGSKTDPATQALLTGPLYERALVPILWLEPGESIELPAALRLLGEEAYETRRLYFGGVSKMKAVEACYSPDSSWTWVPCLEGGQDTWEFQNPPSP